MDEYDDDEAYESNNNFDNMSRENFFEWLYQNRDLILLVTDVATEDSYYEDDSNIEVISNESFYLPITGSVKQRFATGIDDNIFFLN